MHTQTGLPGAFPFPSPARAWTLVRSAFLAPTNGSGPWFQGLRVPAASTSTETKHKRCQGLRVPAAKRSTDRARRDP
eukprot:1160602-Pelagomonas_calceolata.AAC.13